MNIYINDLKCKFKKSEESIVFTQVSCFYGKMGAGKSSIVKLIDYCLGGKLDYSPALQNEFVSVKICLSINDKPLEIERIRDSDKVIAKFQIEGESYQIVVPVKVADGELISGSGIENLSDLIFTVAGVKPPKVRKSKVKADTKLERLSIRDLLWYCYLDQDSFDSSFFNLELSGHPFKRLKSKDVLRYVVGYHQEKVAELEVQLQEISDEIRALETSSRSIKKFLHELGYESETVILDRIDRLDSELVNSTQFIIETREKIGQVTITHAVDGYREKAKLLSGEISSLEDALENVDKTIANDQRHLNELIMMQVKFDRTTSARAVLGGLEFIKCPRCANNLPERTQSLCPVCGTEENNNDVSYEHEVLLADLGERINELHDSITRHKTQRAKMNKALSEIYDKKTEIDSKINEQMKEYDSAYLSTVIEAERNVAHAKQEIKELNRMLKLPKKVAEMERKANKLTVDRKTIFKDLKDAREEAEADTKNIRRLEKLFLDCLLRSRVDGIKQKDRANINSPNFLPEIISTGTGDLAVASFSNLSSGGKKNLFKACFALALHRLAHENSESLPKFLIIDSPMKNISERENRDQFEGFSNLVYELAAGELNGHQFILVDKEFFPPKSNIDIDITTRYMTPNETENPPLITYYRGL